MNDNKTLINNLTEGPITRQLLLYSLPIVLGNLLHTLYNLVDTAVVGQFVGSVGLSAVSTAGQITFILYALGIGFGCGGQILVAQQVGTDNRPGITKTIGTSFLFNIILGVAVMLVGLALTKPALRLLNTPDEAMTDAVEYLLWCCVGIPFTYVNGGMSAVLRGMGDSKHPTMFTAVAAVANVGLDFLLVAVFGLRAKGAAIATSAAQALGAVYCGYYLFRHHEQIGFDFTRENFRLDRTTLLNIVKLGTPLAFQSIAITISMTFITAWVNVYGTVASAVNGVGSKLYSLTTVVTNSMETAVATFTGQNFAARRKDRLNRCMGVSMMICMAFWLVLTALCVVCPRLFFLPFTSESAVLDMAPVYMHIQIVMYLSFATMSTPIGFINGVGNVRLNFIIAIIDGVVARIGLSLLLADLMGIGLTGYWWASALAGFVSTIWGWIYYLSGRWEHRRLIEEA